MNRALLSPFVSADLPRGVEETLKRDEATCAAFNRHGNLLAVGTITGSVTLWDFDSRSVATVLKPPSNDASRVTTVAFPAPRNGSTVLVGYVPGTFRMFDTLSNRMIMQVKFPIQIVDLIVHPRHSEIAVVVPEEGCPIVVYFRKGVYEVGEGILEAIRGPEQSAEGLACEDQMGCLEKVERKIEGRAADAFGNCKFSKTFDGGVSIKFSLLCAEGEFKDGVPVEMGSSTRRKSPFCVAFLREGDSILRGGMTGLIRVFKMDFGELNGSSYEDRTVATACCVRTICVQGRAPVRSIMLSRKAQKVLVNSQDRSMRLFRPDQVFRGAENDLQPLNTKIIEPAVTFTEIVNRTQFTCACFSSNGEYVLGGMEGTGHKIHIWRAIDGHLELTLEGSMEGVAQIAWHPLRGVITSVGNTMGHVYVWAQNVTEKWSAFATELSELEANEEYMEAEDEFDIKKAEDEETRIKAREVAEAALVDVHSYDDHEWFSSDSESENSYFYIPAVPAEKDDGHPPSLSAELIQAQIARARVSAEQLFAETENGDGRKRVGDARKRGRPGKRPRAGRRRNVGESRGAENSSQDTPWLAVRRKETPEFTGEDVKLVDTDEVLDAGGG